MTLFALDGQEPEIHPDAYVAPTAQVIGKVRIMAGASVWFGAVLRGDNEWIELGPGSNIQDNAVAHTDPGFPLLIGRNVTVGHSAIVHGCVIEDEALVGMGATVLNGARIGRRSLVGAGALVTEGKEIPAGSLVLGSPGKVARELSEEAQEAMQAAALSYQERVSLYRAGLVPLEPTR